MTTCPYTTEKEQLVDYNLVMVIDVHLLSCTKTCELTSSGRSKWYSRKSLNLEMLFSGALLRSGKISSWLFAPSGWKLGHPLNNPQSYIPSLLKPLSHLRIIVRAIAVRAAGFFWYWDWNFLLTIVMDCIWTFQWHTEFFLKQWMRMYPYFCFDWWRKAFTFANREQIWNPFCDLKIYFSYFIYAICEKI